MKVDLEFRALRACLRDATFHTGAPPDFDGVRADLFLDLVDEQRLAPWLARHRSRWPNLPDAIGVELDALYYREARDAGARALEIRAVQEALTGAPECILLKGAAWLAESGADLADRPFWDLDLLVRDASSADHVVSRLIDAGFRSIRGDREHHHRAALRRPGGELAVEIHTDLHTPSPGPSFLDAMWTNHTPAPAPWYPFRIPAPTARLAHQALHALSDPVDSPLLRNLYEVARDWAAFDSNQRAEFHAITAKTPLATTIRRALALTHRWFGTPPPDLTPVSGWPERVIEWRVRQLPDDQRLSKLMRHLAREASDSIKKGEPPGTVRLPVRVAFRTVQRWARARRGSSKGWNDRRVPPDWATVEIDGSALVADARSGAVHLLRADVYSAWKAAHTGASSPSSEIRKALRDAGLLP